MSGEFVTVQAHFDGKVIVPDEPLKLPVGAPLYVEVRVHTAGSPRADVGARLAALNRFVAAGTTSARIPDEALRRESLYADDGR